MKSLFTTILFMASSLCTAFAQFTTVFQQNTEGYSCFRIPAIARSPKGTLLAFAEGRKNSCSDTGNIDIVLRRSTDGGRTWGNLQVVWDAGDNVCGNACPIVDSRTGRIVLVCCWNLGADHEPQIIDGTSISTRKVYTLYSDDDGLTWSTPVEITQTVKHTDWTWYATGPCHGIQLKSGKHKGRMVVGTNHMVSDTKAYHSALIYSDDCGQTWQLGGITAQPGGNESTVTELKGDSLMLNMRNYDRKDHPCRAFVTSTDAGATVSPVQFANQLIEPVCQASLITMMRRNKPTAQLVFCNPSSTTNREKLTLHLSTDNGRTWPHTVLVNAGPSAYSDLVQLSPTQVGLLFECGINDAYETISFTVTEVSFHK